MGRKRSERRFDIGRPEIGRVPLAVENDKAFNPVAINLLGTNAVVLEAANMRDTSR